MAEKEADILGRVKEAREKCKKRKFQQTWDLAINLKGLDLKKPESRINSELQLPEGRGKDVKVAIFADSIHAKAGEAADLVIRKEEIDGLSKDPKKLKRVIDENEWFFGEMNLMPQIGKTLGQVMGPRGKVPKPLPPNANLKAFVEGAKKTVKIRVTTTPVLHIPVGTDKMTDEQVVNNINSLINFVKEKLPKGKNNIKTAYIKLTMGPAIKLPLKL